MDARNLLPGLIIAGGILAHAAFGFAQNASLHASQADVGDDTVVAEAGLDLDGDGRDDAVRLLSPPAVSVMLSGGGQLWKPFAGGAGGLLTSGHISVGHGPRYGGRVVIAATGGFSSPRASAGTGAGAGAGRTRPTQHHAMVLMWQERELVKLWEGAVGAQGRDAGHWLQVEATPYGLLRYQSRADIVRCDGATAYLYPEAWDFASARFRPVYNLPRIAADATVLVARTEIPPPLAGAQPPRISAAFRTRSASAQAHARQASELVPPRELDDGDPQTIWRERLGGDGRGEFITATTHWPAAEVVAVRLVPGDASSAANFRRGNRLRRVGLLVGENRAYWVTFPRDPQRGSQGKGGPQTAYWVQLPEPVPAQCVTLVLDRVYRGTDAKAPNAGDTAIADFAVFTNADTAGGGPDAALVAEVLAGAAGATSARHLLSERGPSAIAALMRALRAPERGANERLQLRRVLAATVTRMGRARSGVGESSARQSLADAVTELRAGVADGGTPAADRGDFARAMGTLGTLAVLSLAGLAGDAQVAEEVRVMAVETLATMGRSSPTGYGDSDADSGDPSGDRNGDNRLAQEQAEYGAEMTVDGAVNQALLAMAGRGPWSVRKAVALGLAHRGMSAARPLLSAIVQAVAETRAAHGSHTAQAGPPSSATSGAETSTLDGLHGREADLWRALGLLLRARNRGNALDSVSVERAMAAMHGRLADAADYEVVYRLFAAAAPVADATVGETLAAASARIRSESPRRKAEVDVIQRTLAVALAENPHAHARTLLISLMQSEDPGTRLAAAGALASRTDAIADTDTALAERLRDDAWPRVRRQAATGLGRRCGSESGPAQALFAAVNGDAGDDGDDDAGVRRAALSALVACRAHDIGAQLLTIAGNKAQPVSVRGHAIALVPSVDDSDLAPALVQLFVRLRREAWSNSDSLRLATTAAAAMGRLAAPVVVQPLLSTARDPAFPELQAAAVVGLGEFCPAGALPLLAELRASPQRQVALAARGAHPRCVRMSR